MAIKRIRQRKPKQAPIDNHLLFDTPLPTLQAVLMAGQNESESKPETLRAIADQIEDIMKTHGPITVALACSVIVADVLNMLGSHPHAPLDVFETTALVRSRLGENSYALVCRHGGITPLLDAPEKGKKGASA